MQKVAVGSKRILALKAIIPARNTIDMIYAMCDVQTDIEVVMRYVRTAQEVVFVWYPDEIVT